MALVLNADYSTPYGATVPSTYWRWVALGVSVPDQTCTITVHAYLSEDAFLSGKAAIGQRVFTVKGADFATLTAPVSDALSSAIYAHVRTDPAFANAVDA